MSAKNTKKGFTLIEVILFLAISSAILLAILSGANRSLHQQRYNESVQDLYSFLKNQYSSVINVENVHGSGTGKIPGYAINNQAIYGKLIVIHKSIIESYTLIGKALDSSLSGIADTSSVDSIFNDASFKLYIRGAEKTVYNPEWDSEIKFPNGDNLNGQAIAVLRSPLNGSIYTYVSKKHGAGMATGGCAYSATCNFYTSFSDSGNKFLDAFEQGTVDICVASDDLPSGSKKRNIRITNSGSVDSVRLIKMDDNDNTPDVDGGIKGNRCP